MQQQSESLDGEQQKAHIEAMKAMYEKYQELVKEDKSNYYKKEGEVGYVVNMQWFRQWEQMVYFSDFNYLWKPEYDPDVIREIGPVNNEILVEDESKVWTNSDKEDYWNYVMKGDLRLSKDYKIVPESIWKLFKESYGGTEIKRYYWKGYSYGAEIEATLKEFPIVVFPEF